MISPYQPFSSRFETISGHDASIAAPAPSSSEVDELFSSIHALARNGAWDEACNRLLDASAEHEFDPAFHYLHAMLLCDNGSTDAAVAALLRATALNPDLLVGHYALGQLAGQQGLFRERSRHFQTALDLIARQAPDAVVPYSGGLSVCWIQALIVAAQASALNADV